MEQLLPFHQTYFMDGTIQIASNFTIYRNWKGFLNYILNIIQKNQYGAIKERDIIVMIQDINSYAPFVSGQLIMHHTSFSITLLMNLFQNKDSIISALLAILELNIQFTQKIS